MFKTSKKLIISGAIGNALEMYDYVIWGLFSVFIAKEFLPPQSKLSDIFFLFFISYILRPIGSLLGGILADQAGRKKVLSYSIVLMGIGTTAIGILPSYQQISMLSVFLLMFIRLVQIFSIGNEYISSISLLIESCDKEQKGYFGSWAAFGVNAGMLISSLAGALILYLIDIQIIPQWSWRLAFIFAFVTMIVGFWVRSSIPESQQFIINNARKDKRKFKDIFNETFCLLKQESFDSFVVFTLVLFGAATTVLMFVYAPIHLVTINNLSRTQAFLSNSAGLLIVTILIPFMGKLSDIFGRIKIILMAMISLLLLITPYFISLSSGNFSQILVFDCIMAIPCSAIFSTIPVFITEIFPLSVRCSIVNFLYSIAACLGGGVTPYITVKLGETFHYAPSYFLATFGLLGLLALTLYMKKENLKAQAFLLVE
jgi:MHS family proline/betaine transporter-like MFS transporter